MINSSFVGLNFQNCIQLHLAIVITNFMIIFRWEYFCFQRDDKITLFFKWIHAYQSLLLVSGSLLKWLVSVLFFICFSYLTHVVSHSWINAVVVPKYPTSFLPTKQIQRTRSYVYCLYACTPKLIKSIFYSYGEIHETLIISFWNVNTVIYLNEVFFSPLSCFIHPSTI